MKNNYRIVGNRCYIELNSRKYGTMETVIDVEDFERVNAYDGKWYIMFDKTINGFYVRINIKFDEEYITYLLHRIILNLTDSKIQADHINRNTLDNIKDNLRAVSNRENQHNRGKQKNNTSGFQGVSWDKARGKWRASIKHRGKRRYLGLFDTPQEASAAYEHERSKLHTHYAKEVAN